MFAISFHATSIHYALLRKELRQLAPVAIAVSLLAAISYLCYEFRPDVLRNIRFSQGYILLAIPSLFAVGAGAMSIGQEKESRTLAWLASLPLSRERLYATKFLAALICWVGLWLITVLACLGIDQFGFEPAFSNLEIHPIYSSMVIFWLLHSLYLLVCGQLTAWRFGSSMISLLALVPLALAPSILRFAAAYAMNPGHQFGSIQYDTDVWQSSLSLVILLVPALYLMNRFAIATLSPQEARLPKTKLPKNPYLVSNSAIGLPVDATKRSSLSVLGPSSAILWQHFRQNQVILCCLFGICLIAVLPPLLFADSRDSRSRIPWEGIAIFCVFVSTAWVSVLTFQSDNLQERVRFLAERGVRPARVWLIRLLAPLSLISLMTLFYAWLSSRYLLYFPNETPLPIWIAFSVLLIAVGYAQWFSQLIRNPILSAICAPIVVGIAIFSIVFTTIEVQTKYTSVLLVILPFFATFVMMRHWMDRRFRWTFWCFHLSLILLALSLPLAEAAWQVSRVPTMPGEVKQALRKEASEILPRNNPSAHTITTLSLVSPSLSSFFGDGALGLDPRIELASRGPATDELIEHLEQSIPDQPQPQISYMLLDHRIGVIPGGVILARNRALHDDQDADAIEQYRLQMRLLALLAQTLRQSTHLKSQEQADILEIALIAELQQPESESLLGRETRQRYVQLVSDPKARNQARRRAVVASWWRFDQLHDSENPSSEHFGGFYIEYSRRSFNTLSRWIYPRQVDHLAWTLIRYLELGPTASQQGGIATLRQRLRAEMSPTSHLPPYLQNFWYSNQVSDPARFQFPTYAASLPAEQWFGDWERIGEQLSTQPLVTEGES